MKNYKTIDEYIKSFPKERQAILKEVRDLIRKLLPKVEEAIKYGMPTVRLNDKNLFHYALMKKHFGFYPAPSGVKAFEDEFKKKGYKYSKGAVQFPLDEKLPLAIMTKIIKFRINEERGKIGK